jgi:hypothetical protein
MKLRLLFPTLAVLFGSMAAHAQVGLYLNPVVTRISNSTPDTGIFAFLGDGDTSRIFGGVDFGGYYDFAHYAKADVGFDLRDTIQHGNNATLNSFQFGLRVAAKPLDRNLKPYIQVSVGEGRSKSPLSPIHIAKLEYGVSVGVDKPLNKHVDWRILEVGYGSVTTVSSLNFDGTATYPASHLINFSTGLVFRIP